MNNWVLYNKKQNIKEISSEFNITPLTAVVLCNRDIKISGDVKKILSSDINDLNNAKLLPDVDNACEILYKNIQEKKSIRIVGDYDIDGVCSTYILYDSIKKLGGKVSYVVPDRRLDGYGINNSIIDEAIKDKIDLIVTCDNGITASEQITYAKQNGISCIVTDHHDISELPKDALAIINPKRKDVENCYPFTEICGTVVAWKFMMRLYELYGVYDKSFVIDKYLEFAMLATIGDIMPLVNENHIIAKLGLKKIMTTENKGLKKLLEVTNVDFTLGSLSTYYIGFVIGPLINAAGRMEKADIALSLFIEDNQDNINRLSIKLKQLNDERKLYTDEGTKSAIRKIEKNYLNDKILVVYDEGIEEQVAGIVAGRIKEKYNKPTIILTNTMKEDEIKGSCRSIEAYDIFEALNKHNEMFLKFGGHKLAAGFTILKKDIEELRKNLNEETTLVESDFIKKIYIDAEFPFYEFNEEIIKDIEKIEPYGQGFAKPVFVTRDVKAIITNIYGADKNVIKLKLVKDEKFTKGVAFMDSETFIDRTKNDKNIDILYFPKINEYKNVKNVEISLTDYR